MSLLPHTEKTGMLFGFFPKDAVTEDHLARLVDQVVDEAGTVPHKKRGPGQPAFDPRVCL